MGMIGPADLSTDSTRPKRKRRTRVMAVALGVIIILGLSTSWAFGFLPFVVGPPDVVVTQYCGGYWQVVHVDYSNGNASYLVANPGPLPQYCTSGSQVPPRSLYSASLVLENSDRMGHSISQIVIAPPFTAGTITPGLPTQIGPNGDLTFAVSVQVPSIPGTYGLPSATVTTT